MMMKEKETAIRISNEKKSSEDIRREEEEKKTRQATPLSASYSTRQIIQALFV